MEEMLDFLLPTLNYLYKYIYVLLIWVYKSITSNIAELIDPVFMQ